MQNSSILPVLYLQLMVTVSIANPLDSILVRSERYLRQTVSSGDIESYLTTINKANQWPDINYSAKQSAGWEPAIHLRRLHDMAFAWSTLDSPFYRQASLKKAIDGVLDHWLEKQYESRGWWHKIGVPRIMRDVIILLRHDLTEKQFKLAMEVLGQHEVGGYGANLVWSADLGLHYGALAGDAAMVEKCSNLLSQAIKVTASQGIQSDYSFHQHGARLQMFDYGGSFLRENIKLAWELRDTPWAFPEEKIAILADFVLKGWQWMARGIHTVPGTLDRSVSRANVLRSADLRKMVPYLCELNPDNADLFRALADRQDGKGAPLTGFRYYPRSDFAAYHHRDFSFFLKTISDRTKWTESINGENLKGRLLNAGDSYFIRDGNEYYNMMPVWDWEHLPGITSFKGAHVMQQAFTGSVSNGESGLTIMHLRAENQNKNLSVNKFWACHKNLVINLIANVRSDIMDTLYTVLDQSRWRSDVFINKPAAVLSQGKHTLTNVDWIHHSRFAYIPLSPAKVNLHLQAVTGTWSSINTSGSNKPITEKVFMPVLLHDPQSISSGYVTAYCKTPKEAQKLKRKPAWKIISNDAKCQAVQFRDGTFMAAFASETSVLKNRKWLSVNRPCLVMASGNKFWISDPGHKGGTITIRLEDEKWDVNIPPNGESVQVVLH